jgi:hypothetical protein
VVVCALMACSKGEDNPADKGSAAGSGTVDLDNRCVQLGKVCGDQGKHVNKIVDECKLAAKPENEKGCTDKAVAVYDCYEKELCLGSDKVWALDDLRVLADRRSKCLAEMNALHTCTGKKP